MMFEEFTGYLHLGVEHILDPNGLDHVLFLFALAIPFSIKQWKTVLILVTAFTIGHSLTLFLAGLDLIKVSSQWVEISIAFSIFITALYNIYLVKKQEKPQTRYLAALFFGLIHGLGFSSFFRSLLGDDSIIFPLFSFNLGVEFAQLIIVLAILLLNFFVTRTLKVKKEYWIYSTSCLIAIWSLKLIIDRL